MLSLGKSVVNPSVVGALLWISVLALSGGMTTAAREHSGVSHPLPQAAANVESKEPGPADRTSPAESTGAAPENLLTAAVPSISGPKRTISVGRFDAIGAFTAKYGSWDIGGGLSAMMTSALVESERFIVVERANLQQVLSEQELKAAGLTSAGTGPGAGKLTGVQFLVFGSVTEFGVDDEGGGFSLGASGGGLGNLFSAALSQQSASGTVAIDIRLVDSTSGQVVENHRLKEEISSSGWDISGGYQGISLGTNQFYKTPLGQAVRNVITTAVQRIAAKAQETGWTGLVVDYDGEEMYINAGQRAGITKGDKFIIERLVKKLTDPTTQEVLSIRKKELGIIEITGVEQKLSYGVFMPLDVTAPQRGDFVASIK